MRGFVLQDVEAPGPTEPTSAPTPTDPPTTGPAEPTDPTDPGTTIPDTGGPPLWAAVVAFLMLAAGVGLVVADRSQGRRRGPA